MCIVCAEAAVAGVAAIAWWRLWFYIVIEVLGGRRDKRSES